MTAAVRGLRGFADSFPPRNRTKPPERSWGPDPHLPPLVPLMVQFDKLSSHLGAPGEPARASHIASLSPHSSARTHVMFPPTPRFEIKNGNSGRSPNLRLFR